MRKYLIISSEEISKIDFNKILQTSLETLRYSVDGNKILIKWDTDEDPDFISNFKYFEGPYNDEEILKIISTNIWTTPIGKFK